MPVTHRLRRLLAAALPAVLAVALTACNADYPNSIFHNHTEFNREVGYLFKILVWLGTFVFVFVETLLVVAMWRYRRKGENDRPEHVHGNTVLEITWTAIPALILAFIAVPTVQTIFKTQAKARADALQVEVIGHQWWWEFRYPQYHFTTANELYLPIGRTVNFSLKSGDVLHSFWIPQLGGKRDLITNHTNYLWYTPDSIGVTAVNGMCAEYCGSSHANMRFKTFVVTPADFASWAAHQQTPAAFGAATPPGPPGGFIAYPRDKLPAYVIPSTPLPDGMSWNESVKGDAERGRDFLTKFGGGCAACHTISGNASMVGQIGPNLTHIGSRTTIAAGLYPNDTKHLALWIKNARYMKPGVIMPTLGAFQRDPVTKMTIPKTGLSDAQIADIVAYLQSLK